MLLRHALCVAHRCLRLRAERITPLTVTVTDDGVGLAGMTGRDPGHYGLRGLGGARRLSWVVSLDACATRDFAARCWAAEIPLAGLPRVTA